MKDNELNEETQASLTLIRVRETVIIIRTVVTYQKKKLTYQKKKLVFLPSFSHLDFFSPLAPFHAKWCLSALCRSASVPNQRQPHALSRPARSQGTREHCSVTVGSVAYER